MRKVAVLMPFHKAEMNQYERLSFENNVRVLKKHPIFLLLPNGLNDRPFLTIAPYIKVKFLSPRFFTTYWGSNLLWLESEIYNTFKEYKYLLKCELDSFVFRDELSEWCEKGYDYVGAPWINNPRRIHTVEQIFAGKNGFPLFMKKVLSGHMHRQSSFVGNGGLSLRRTKTFRHISKTLPYIFPNIFKENYQEDVVWSIYVASYFSHVFKRPHHQKAVSFSIETNPKECIELNHGSLPFGCHAWYKYDLAFWKPYVTGSVDV